MYMRKQVLTPSEDSETINTCTLVSHRRLELRTL